jgi:cellulose synthase/poly-beta-1,6-N-acetylglucosamine synthase-like glycosyltransferase
MSVLSFILQAAFWFSVVALVHSYAFYPLLLKWLARNRRNNELVHTSADPDGEWPHLVAAMAAHNEESVIAATLDSIFASDYPADRFEVIVAADNCSDRTVEIVRSFQAAHPNLILRVLGGRNGKIRSLNLVLEEHRERLAATCDHALILCDANVRWSRELPRELVKHFRNPRIGQVASNVLDGRGEHSGIADQEEAYVNRENGIKYREGVLWGRMMGAFGACFAMRGSLFMPVPEGFRSDDFTHTMRCFEQGYDAIVEPAAIAWEDVSEDIGVEFGRKKRISLGNFQNLSLFWRFLQPWRAGWATWFAFWSHKGIRWFGPFLIAAALLSSAALAGVHWIYALAFAGQIALIGGAGADAILSLRGRHFRLLRYARYFLLMNVALAVGAWRFVAGEKNAFWEPAKRVVADHSPPAGAITGTKETTATPVSRNTGAPV